MDNFGFTIMDTSPPPQYGTDEIGQLMVICEQHTRQVTIVYPEGGHPHPGYREGWEACEKVRKEWLGSEIARQQREAKEQEERDKQRVEAFAKAHQ